MSQRRVVDRSFQNGREDEPRVLEVGAASVALEDGVVIFVRVDRSFQTDARMNLASWRSAPQASPWR